jgi:alpha 1,3-glucosidase
MVAPCHGRVCQRVRRSTKMMRDDPYTLTVCVDASLAASGQLYLDDEETFAFKQGQWQLRQFELKGGVLRATAAVDSPAPPTYLPANAVERVVVVGGQKPSKVTVTAGGLPPREVAFYYDEAAQALELRKVGVKVAEDFELAFAF